MSAHYKNAHKNHEVFISRLSDDMVDKLKKESDLAIRFDRSNGKHLAAFCFFCRSVKQFLPNFWIRHIQMHTGEFAYECTICQKSHTVQRACCSQTVKMKYKTSFYHKNLNAFICKRCNFIQISEKNVRAHLKNEHGYNQIDHLYDKVILLPALKSIKTPILQLHDIRFNLDN